MGGKSDQAQGAENLQGLMDNFYTDIQKEKGFSTDNLFSNYKTPYGFDSMSSELDKLLSQEKSDINRQAGSDIQTGTKALAERLASQGITGGSVLNDSTTSIGTDVNKSKYNALADVSKSRLGQNVGLMNLENQNSFQNTSANQSQLNQQVSNLFQKYGLLQGNLGQQAGNVGNLDSSTFWDDIFSGVTSVGSLLNPLSGLLGGGSKPRGGNGGGG